MLFTLLAVMTLGTSSSYAAVSWLKLPIACLPERGAQHKWIDGQDESGQAPCHCPPSDMCPKTYEEYSNNDKARLPWLFVSHCCPTIQNPNCPDGTPRDGNGNCKCPDGNYPPANGVCPVAQCPSKWYPTLADSGIGNGSSPHYTENGTTYDFSSIAGGLGNDSYAMRLGSRYNFSLRGLTMLYWVWGPNFCHTYGNGSSAFGGGDLSQQMCAVEGFSDGSGYAGAKGYAAMTNGANNTSGPDLSAIVNGGGGPSNMTWFGFSVARIDQLPNNSAKADVVANINKAGLDLVQIADNGWHGSGSSTSFDTSGSYGFRMIHDSVGLTDEQPDFVAACHSVAGEYVTVLNHTTTVDGANITCPYLQCRYVYDSTMESCLSEGTKITLADGSTKPVEALKLGDTVKGTDGNAQKVEALNLYQSTLRVLYGINGAGPTLTGDHPIKTTEGWKVITDDAAKQFAGKDGFVKESLKVGDEIVTENGTVKVESIHRFAMMKPVSTYNLRVKGDDSFYANGMAVKGFSRMEMHY